MRRPYKPYPARMSPWAAITGAAKWIACTPVDGAAATERAAVCVGCPSLVRVRVKGLDLTAGFCGPPLAPTANTCGCLVLWGTTERPDAAAGKCTCKGEKCPQGRF